MFSDTSEVLKKSNRSHLFLPLILIFSSFENVLFRRWNLIKTKVEHLNCNEICNRNNKENLVTIIRNNIKVSVSILKLRETFVDEIVLRKIEDVK